MIDDVLMDPKNTGMVYFDVSPTGAAVYATGFARPRDRSVVYMDRSGHSSPVTAAKRPCFGAALSPDGGRTAAAAARRA